MAHMASMQRRVRHLLVPLIAIAILLGAFVGVAASSDEDGRRTSASAAPADDATRFLDHLADELGVTRSELMEAVARASDSSIDDLQSADLLTGAQAQLARDAVRGAATNPARFKASLPALGRRLAPYKNVADGLQRSVGRALTAELGVSQDQLVRSARQSGLARVAARQGAERATVLAATRRAARRAVAPALSRGLLTPTQASIIVDGTVAAVAHHW
jgi:hypothetical protein